MGQVTGFPAVSLYYLSTRQLRGGGGGIRTHETLSGLTVFKTAGFNRSPTPPASLSLAGYSSRSNPAEAGAFAGEKIDAAVGMLCSAGDIIPREASNTRPKTGKN